ncbi:sulfurtransferase complex subunit TusB [Salmonella enterica subsp. enterica serovar Senftenberg]|nr:sulfurtransferase complex subunit TusB [Salmonella enterica subsp. enterica serovar Senftenberg]
MLHTLPHCASSVDFPALLRLLKEGMRFCCRDGVTVAIEGNRFLESLRDAPITVYALKEDIDARGLGGQISDSVVRVDYTEFVRLTVKYASQMAR